MKTVMKAVSVFFGILLACILIFPISAANCMAAQSIDQEWSKVETPQMPALEKVRIDPASTALLMLDFNKQTCNADRSPRCIATLSKVQKLLTEARAKGVAVIYSLSGGADTADIAIEVSHVDGEPIVTSGPDKFLGTDLDVKLKAKKITTVIVVGTSAHGAVLYTASGAALRGLKVIVPVDGLSAEQLYPEQYTVWHLKNAPRVSAQVTLTKIDLIEY